MLALKGAIAYLGGMGSNDLIQPPTPQPLLPALPSSVRLSDGTSFYVAAKTGQLPLALVGGRLDANIGSWLGATTPTVGQKTLAASLPVALASDQALPLPAGAATEATLSSAKVDLDTLVTRTPDRSDYHDASIASQTTDQTVYTVTPGKTFYCTSLVVFVSNTSGVNPGQLHIHDGGAGGALKLPVTLTNTTNQSGSQLGMSLAFLTPMRFTSSVFAQVVNGTLVYSVTVVGYEL